jgi:hypothetical protein
VLVVVSGAGLDPADGVVQAQRNGNPKPPPTLQNGPATLPSLEQPAVIGPDPMHAHMDEERMKAMNDDRRKKLSADVERLLALTNELKSDVDKANKDELSVSVIRKAAEIEKLAHDVQSRMKN